MDEQAWGVFRGEGIICGPLVEDEQDEVTKQAGHEDYFWDEAQKDVQRLLKVPAEQQVGEEHGQHQRSAKGTKYVYLLYNKIKSFFFILTKIFLF